MSLKKLPLINAALAVFLMVGSLAASGPKLPRPLADVSLDTPGAKRIRLNATKSKARIVVVLSSECEHCVSIVKELSKLERAYRARGVQVFGALVDEAAAQQLPTFVAKTSPSFPIGTLSQDNTRRLADFGINDHPFVPIVMFIDGTNTVRYQFHGDEGIFVNNVYNTLKNLTDVVLKAK
jgi:thiol-disulfide isomerase/thioredoxin